MAENKKSPLEMTFDEIVAAAERMPADIRDWFDSRVVLLQNHAGLEPDCALRTALILARAEYKEQSERKKNLANALDLLVDVRSTFEARAGRFLIRATPGTDAGVVVYVLPESEAGQAS